MPWLKVIELIFQGIYLFKRKLHKPHFCNDN